MPASEAAGVWTLLAGVLEENVASLALHERAGFRRIGDQERIGRDPPDSGATSCSSNAAATGCRHLSAADLDLAFSLEEASRLMYYVAHGSIPRQRHTQHRAADGSLYAEDCSGSRGHGPVSRCSTA